MNTQWQINQQSFELHRFPKGEHDKSLQAWDSADEYLIQHFDAEFGQKGIKTLTIFNDSFGALATALGHIKRYFITDSYISQQACLANCSVNNIEPPEFMNSLEALPKSDLILIKLTKNLGFLEHQLQQISALECDIPIIAAGKTNLVTSSVMALFEKYCNQVTSSLAQKKSRLIFAKSKRLQYESKFPIATPWPELQLTLFAHANVFSKEQIDIGGRFLAENLPQLQPHAKVIDLGCGNGLLGLACLAQTNKTQIELDFVDESFMAVESAKLNVQRSFPDAYKQCRFIQDDCLTGQLPNHVDFVLCNPPFHQQNTLTEHIAQQMFEQAKTVLKSGGSLFVVANRHLSYQSRLKKLFGGFKVHAQNKKFIIYHCYK